MKTVSFLFALGFTISGCGASAEKKTDDKNPKSEGAPATDTAKVEQTNAETPTAADKFSDHIENSLIASGMNADQAHALGDQVMDSVDGSTGLSLQSLDKEDLSKVGPFIVEKFTEALGKEGVAGDDEAKGNLASTIADSSIVYMKDIDQMSDDVKNETRGKFLAAVVAKLDEAGVSHEKMTKIIAKISQKAVSAFEKSGLTSDKVAANIPQVMDKLFAAIANTGLDQEKIVSGIGDVTEGISKGVVETNATDGAFFSDALSKVMDKSISLLEKVGVKEPEKIAVAMEKLASAGAAAVREVKEKKSATVKPDQLANISEKIALKANEAALTMAKKLEIAADKIASATAGFSNKFDESQKEILAEKYQDYITAKDKSVEAVITTIFDPAAKEDYYAKLQAEMKARCEAQKGIFAILSAVLGKFECKQPPSTTTDGGDDKPSPDNTGEPDDTGFKILACGGWGDKPGQYKLEWLAHNGISAISTSPNPAGSQSLPYCYLTSANEQCGQYSGILMELMSDPAKPEQCVTVPI